MQAFLSLMFLKIDKRNKILTKHGEDTIKVFEKKYYTDKDLQLFTKEEIKTDELKNKCKGQFICCRPLSHGKAFIHIFYFFFFVGLIGSICSLVQCCKSKIPQTDNEKIDNVINNNNTSTKNIQISIFNDSIGSSYIKGFNN